MTVVHRLHRRRAAIRSAPTRRSAGCAGAWWSSEPRDDAYGLARATWAHAGGWTALALALALRGRGVLRARHHAAGGAPGERHARASPRGAFGISVPVEGPPEIAELARTFNEASQQLVSYDAENRKLLLAVERGYLEMLRALVNAIEAKDPYTAGHSQRTAEFAVAIGRSSGVLLRAPAPGIPAATGRSSASSTNGETRLARAPP